MWKDPAKRRYLGLLTIRIGLGLTFLFIHGGPKLLGGPERWARVGHAMQVFGIDFAPTFWGLIAALSEFVGGLLLMLGLFFPWALIPPTLTLLVAALGYLTGLIPGSLWYPLEIAVVFVALMFTGPGRYSLDARRVRPQVTLP